MAARMNSSQIRNFPNSFPPRRPIMIPGRNPIPPNTTYKPDGNKKNILTRESIV